MTKQNTSEASNATLGHLHYDSEGKDWVTTINVADNQVILRIAGTSEPDKVLVKTAEKIIERLQSLHQYLSTFLQDQAAIMSSPNAGDEVEKLIISEIMIAWPDYPEKVMFFFVGPNTEHLWHCDYDFKVFSGLACDT